MSKRCIYCYLVLNENEIDFHPRCSKKMFSVTNPPVLLYSENDIDALALEVLQTQAVITGVQPKLSLHLTTAEQPNVGKRFTIVGMWGDYILNPASSYYLHLPEVKDLTMHLATLAKINVVLHCLIRLASGNLAYITKRIDRIKKEKVHMEDM